METNQNTCVTWPFDIIANDNSHMGPEGGEGGEKRGEDTSRCSPYSDK